MDSVCGGDRTAGTSREIKKHSAKEYARYQLAFDSTLKASQILAPGKRSVHRDDLSRPASEKMEGYGLAKAEPLFCNAPV